MRIRRQYHNGFAILPFITLKYTDDLRFFNVFLGWLTINFRVGFRTKRHEARMGRKEQA